MQDREARESQCWHPPPPARVQVRGAEKSVGALPTPLPSRSHHLSRTHWCLCLCRRWSQYA